MKIDESNANKIVQFAYMKIDVDKYKENLLSYSRKEVRS